MTFCKDKKKIATETVRCLIAEHHGLTGPVKDREDGCCEPVVNQLSRATIRVNRPCYIWRVNRYDRSKHPIATEYRKGMVFNFEGSFVTKEKDPELLRLLEEREAAIYTGVMDDSARIDAIFARMTAVGGVTLHWE